MGQTKKAIYPYYEALLDEFVAENDREPTAEESSGWWDKALAAYLDAVLENTDET